MIKITVISQSGNIGPKTPLGRPSPTFLGRLLKILFDYLGKVPT